MPCSFGSWGPGIRTVGAEGTCEIFGSPLVGLNECVPFLGEGCFHVTVVHVVQTKGQDRKQSVLGWLGTLGGKYLSITECN